MNYLKKSFTIASPGTKEYADNWERTFRGTTNNEEKPMGSLSDEDLMEITKQAMMIGIWVPHPKEPKPEDGQ